MLRRLAPLLTFVLLAAPASAATHIQEFTVVAGDTITPGRGIITGKLYFKNHAKNVRIRGLIEDICPADGYRVRADFSVFYRSGAVVSHYGRQVYKTGCRGGPQQYAFNTTSVNDGSKIYAVAVHVWEYDKDARVYGDQDTQTYYR